MYCLLCHTDGSPTHESSSGHRAARELAAAAVDRLRNYVTACEDSIEGSPVKTETANIKTTNPVSYCDSCNTVVPITQQATHLRVKKHALTLLNEQTFVELIQRYVDEKSSKSLEALNEDAGEVVDEDEAVDTHTCHLCELDVPLVFRAEHERGSRHRANRTFALAAARRASDTLTARHDTNTTEDGAKFTGKMMKKLLSAFTGKRIDEDKAEMKEAPAKIISKKFKAKEYFTEIIPMLPYVGNSYTLIVDDTEFVTIQIGGDTLKIHFHKLFQFGNPSIFCSLCREYAIDDTRTGKHIRTLQHVKNVISRIRNVHLVLKTDSVHSICAHCNTSIESNLAERHVMEDTEHIRALSEALQRGKEYKERKGQLKIMIVTDVMRPLPKASEIKRMVEGTAKVPYKPNQFTSKELVSESEGSYSIVSITGMKEYENKSLEELRHEDYKAGLQKAKRDISAFAALKPLFGSSSIFSTEKKTTSFTFGNSPSIASAGSTLQFGFGTATPFGLDGFQNQSAAAPPVFGSTTPILQARSPTVQLQQNTDNATHSSGLKKLTTDTAALSMNNQNKNSESESLHKKEDMSFINDLSQTNASVDVSSTSSESE